MKSSDHTTILWLILLLILGHQLQGIQLQLLVYMDAEIVSLTEKITKNIGSTRENIDLIMEYLRG